MSELPEFRHPIKQNTPRARANETQRERRKRRRRIDFYASPETVAVVEGLRSLRIDGTASAILNRIVAEWAAASGIFSPLPPHA